MRTVQIPVDTDQIEFTPQDACISVLVVKNNGQFWRTVLEPEDTIQGYEETIASLWTPEMLVNYENICNAMNAFE